MNDLKKRFEEAKKILDETLYDELKEFLEERLKYYKDTYGEDVFLEDGWGSGYRKLLEQLNDEFQLGLKIDKCGDNNA